MVTRTFLSRRSLVLFFCLIAIALTALALMMRSGGSTAQISPQPPRPVILGSAGYAVVDDGGQGYSEPNGCAKSNPKCKTGRWNRGMFGLGGWERGSVGRFTPSLTYDPGLATARWAITLPATQDLYDVFVTWKLPPPPGSAQPVSDIAQEAPFRLLSGNLTRDFVVDQSREPVGESFLGRPWHLLGRLTLRSQVSVELTNLTDALVLADAVWVRRVKQADIFVSVQPALLLSSGSPSELAAPDYRPGANMQYTFVIGNRGRDTATNVVLTSTLPAQFLPNTGFDNRCTITGTSTKTLRCTYPGGVAINKQITMVLKGKIATTATCGSMVRVGANVIATEMDPQPLNQTDASIQLCRNVSQSSSSRSSAGSASSVPAVPPYVLNTNPNAAAVTVTADRLSASVGDLIRFTVKVTNKKTTTPTAEILNLSVTPGMLIQLTGDSRCVRSPNGRSIGCTFWNMPPSHSATFVVTTTVVAAATCNQSQSLYGIFQNVEAGAGANIPCSPPAVTAEYIVNPSDPLQGGIVNHLLQVRNPGPDPVTVTLQGSLRSGTAYVPNSLGGCALLDQPQSLSFACSIGSVLVGQTKTVSFQSTMLSSAACGSVLDNVLQLSAQSGRPGLPNQGLSVRAPLSVRCP